MTLHPHPIPHFTFASFDAFPNVKHGVLTRRDGVSPAPWDSLNLGWSVGDDDERVETNYARWTQALGVDRSALATTTQVHGNAVIVVDSAQRGLLGEADAMITAQVDVPLVQRFADCTPILLYDPVRHACGIAHAGWQGTAARCAEAAARAMTSTFGSDPADLVAGIGPAIGPCCYEVGPEVAAAIRQSQAHPDRLLTPGLRGRPHLDLWEANAGQLRDAGVRQIEIAGLCTACQRDTFFSHRGDGGRTGRFAAFIMLT